MKLVSKLILVITCFTLPTLLATAYIVQNFGRAQFWLAILISVFLAVISIVAMVFVLNRQIMGPIQALSAAVARVSLGDLSQAITARSNDELGALSRGFNAMTHQLSSTHRSLAASIEAAKEGRAQLVSSIDGLRQGFVLIDMKNTVIMANAAVVQVIKGENTGNKTKTDDHIQLEDVARVLPKDLGLQEKIAETLKSGVLAKFPGLPLNGRFLNLYLSPVMNETEAIGCVLLLEDVTEERIMQRSRDEFFSIASHELRTPLTAIRSNTSMLMQYYPQLLKDPDVSSMLADIHEASIRLITIVNDFLDTSRLEQNKLLLKPDVFALEATIEKIIYEMAGLSRDKHIVLAFDQDTLGKLPPVYADPSRITQILYNLIGNAMKFTEKGNVTINCLLEGSFVKVCVSDTGKGISPEGRQILFHKFQQSTADMLTRDNTRGTGLGLYISKLLIQRMGGAIKLEHSEVGAGSTFSFTVPVATKAQIKTTQALPVTATAPSK